MRAAAEPPRPAVIDLVTLPLADESVPARAARRFAEQHAKPFGTDVVDAAGLVASELVTNAVLHTPGVVELQAGCVEDGLLLSVEDRSTVRPRVRRHSVQSGTGRGLRLAASYAESWGVEMVSGGKHVWALLTRASVAAALDAESEFDLEWADL